jgi:tetratricopeptide (TPR) repeat protein
MHHPKRIAAPRPSLRGLVGRLFLFGMMPIALACSQEAGWESAMAAGQRAAARGDYAAAQRHFTAAVSKGEQFGFADLRVAQALTLLAQAYVAQQKFVEAEPAYLRALTIFQSVRGEEHPDVAAVLNNLGVLHKKHGQYTVAEPYFTRALAIKEKLLGADHPDVGLSLRNLALLYAAQERYDVAEPLFRRGVTIQEKSPEGLELAGSLEQHAAILRKMGRHAEADAAASRAQSIRTGRSQ